MRRNAHEGVRRPETLKKILLKVFPAKKMEEMKTCCIITGSWKDISGEILSRGSGVKALRQGTITVEAESASVRQLIQMSSRKILKKCNEILGGETVKKIKVVVKDIAD